MGAPPLQALLPPRPRWLVRRLDVHHHHHPCVGLLFVLQTRTSSSRTQRSSLTTLVYCIDTLQAARLHHGAQHVRLGHRIRHEPPSRCLQHTLEHQTQTRIWGEGIK
jgi:hypothetical protein